MNKYVQRQLKVLSNDFARTKGQRFDHFFCPILYVDEITALAMGHVIPRSFLDSSAARIVQRKDVDNLFGHFEASFKDIQWTNLPHDELIAKNNVGKLRPKLLHNGSIIESYGYNTKHRMPDNHTLVHRIKDGITEPWQVLKIAPTKSDVIRDGIEIVIDADFRLEALISGIKAAHLTLFRLLGYRYVFDASGFFLGNMVLGDFFRSTHGLRRGSQEFNTLAMSHFYPYINMMRPVVELFAPIEIRDSITDKIILVCWDDNDQPWAVHVFVRFGDMLNSILIPSGSNGIQRFAEMLKSDETIEMDVSLVKFSRSGPSVSPNRYKLDWGPANFDMPC